MILYRYILKEHVSPFVAAFFVITFLFAINFLLEMLDSVLSKGLPLMLLLEIFFLSLAWMLALSIPMACLVAALMAFGRLSSDHEITAIKAAGIAPFQVMRPVLYVAAFLMLSLVVFNNWILPEANHRAGSLISSISRKKPGAFIAQGRLITDFPDVQIWIDRIDQETGVLYGIRIFEMVKDGPPRTTFAEEGTMEYTDMGAMLRLHLRKGTNHYRDSEKEEQYFRIDFENQIYSIKNVDDRFERKERSYRGDRELPIQDMFKIVDNSQANIKKIMADKSVETWKNVEFLATLIKRDTTNLDSLPEKGPLFRVSQLNMQLLKSQLAEERVHLRNLTRTVNSLENEEAQINKYMVEIHKKFSIPVACFIFILIGAPLGIMARKGGLGTGVLYSITFFIVYWVFLMGGETLADKLLLEPWFAMWASNIVTAMVGIYTTYIMSRDNYTGHNKFKDILRWFKSKFSKKRGVV